ncbi:MAG: SH3 domain-containing protein [Chloroflexota bacterium]
MPRWITGLILILLLLASGFVAVAQEANARVNDMSGVLRVRSGPGVEFEVVGELAGRTPLIVSAKSTTLWYQIAAVDGSVEGWAASGFVTLTTITEDEIPFVFPNDISTAGTEDTAEAEDTTTSVDTASTEEEDTESVEAVVAVDNAVTGVVAPLDPNAPTGIVNAQELNFRTGPSTSFGIIGRITRGTTVYLRGRNSSSTWLQVQLADGTLGWVSAVYVRSDTIYSTLPDVEDTPELVGETAVTDTDDAVVADAEPVAVPAGIAPYFTLGAASANIHATSSANATRFSKVGDSITAEEVVLNPFDFGQYELGVYSNLQPTVDYFAASWSRSSEAATPGWTTDSVLNPAFADSSVCEAGETPLACEYRIHNPAVALILFGANDVVNVNFENYVANMNRIVDISIENGVIPVLTSLPPRPDFPARRDLYNQAVLSIATTRGLAYLDLYSALTPLRNAGMSEDGLHPSTPPLGFENATVFTEENLQYGYVMRNLTALQALHVIRTSVLQ